MALGMRYQLETNVRFVPDKYFENSAKFQELMGPKLEFVQKLLTP